MKAISRIFPLFSLLCLATLELGAQDWVHTGTNLGRDRIRIAAADFKPGGGRVEYDVDAAEVPIASLSDRLEMTSGPNWGYQLRRGLVELSDHDFALIREAMTASS